VGLPESWHPRIEPWELALVKKVAQRFRTQERDELESELARRLLDLKMHLPSGVRDWKAYLAKLLYNKAANWVRDQRAHEARSASLQEPRKENFCETFTLEDVLKSPELPHDARLAFARVWQELGPDLRHVWELLLQERGNQVEVARRLSKHRNTVRLWIREIHRALKRHGF
jgi:DNA-directed RNA polymerase specialized sigma24 family protein